MSRKIKAIPEGYHTTTPIFSFKDTRKAIDFYKNAFGATERGVFSSPDGKGIMHAEILVGDSIIMLGDENPQQSCKSAETLGGSPITTFMYVENVDQAFRRAVEAGAQSLQPVADMFWGDRVGTVQDPFGYTWMIATHTKDLTPQEMQQAAQSVQGGCATMATK